MKKTDPFFKPLHNHINKELLKYVVGLYMFCPACQSVLDWKTTVSIDLYRDGKHLRNLVCCTGCFKPKGVARLEAQGIKVEVTKHEESENS
jgi:hypothetical protein